MAFYSIHVPLNDGAADVRPAHPWSTLSPVPSMPLATPKQTRSFLMRRFEEVGIHPKTRHGQNFLIDLNLVELLCDSAALTADDVVLEVGCGTGSLTTLMAPQAAAVVAVEIDPQLAQLAREQLAAAGNVTILERDALASKSRLDEVVMDAVRQRLAEAPGRRFKLAANLPYNVATPIISNLLEADPLPATLTVTIQKELAERIVAVPSTKDYGALSIWIQAQARAQIVRIMPPTVFWPRPKVHSAIVHIEVDPLRRAALGDPVFFHRLVRLLFCHRRKFLRSELLAAARGRLTKPQVDEILAEVELDGTARAESLDVSALVRLSEATRARLGTIEF